MKVEAKYLSKDELTPFVNVKHEWSQAIAALPNKDDWAAQFDACNALRRAIVHHPELISPTSLLEDLLPIADSLRSSLAKNALITLEEMFAIKGKQMESQLEKIGPLLLKKSGDTNVFISAQGQNTLKAMVNHSSESKVLNSVAPYFSSKNAGIKSQVAACLGDLCEKLGPKLKTFKDADKLIIQMSLFLGDANQNVRENTRTAFG
jgi:hypothetical protein